MSLSFKPTTLKAKLDNQPANTQAADTAPDPILDSVDQILADQEKPPILQKIAAIEDLLSREQLPIATLKSACRTVMLSLKENADTILQLEPSDIQQIVQGYMKIADEETKAVLTKTAKKKATKKKGLSFKAKEIQQMAKELDVGGDLDFL